VAVSLAAGLASGSDAQGDTLSDVENVIGSAFSDTLTGDANDNILAGAAGGDRLDGGAGSDTACYASAAAAVTVSLASGSGSGSDAQGDVLISIENLTGSAFNDTLVGDNSANVLAGGDDGADQLNGGGGVDTASYLDSAAAVTVSLATGTGLGGAAEGDVLVQMENVSGSAFNDTLTGDTSVNVLVGGDGNDVINAGAGDDFLVGGAGDDDIIGGDGIDTLSYAIATAGIHIDPPAASAARMAAMVSTCSTVGRDVEAAGKPPERHSMEGNHGRMGSRQFRKRLSVGLDGKCFQTRWSSCCGRGIEICG
jgi:Ca2+-binding RTX toxin-like protein